MTFQEPKYRLAADPAELETVETLLELYPDIDDDGQVRIARYLRSAPSLDVGLLSSNAVAWAAADKLRADRPDLFRPSAKGWLAGIAVLLLSGLMIYWLATFADK